MRPEKLGIDCSRCEGVLLLVENAVGGIDVGSNCLCHGSLGLAWEHEVLVVEELFDDKEASLDLFMSDSCVSKVAESTDLLTGESKLTLSVVVDSHVSSSSSGSSASEWLICGSSFACRWFCLPRI